MSASSGRSTFRGNPLASALADEVSRLEKALARAWQVLAALGALVALGTGVLVPGRLGWSLLLMAAVLFGYFTLVVFLIARGRGQATLRLLSPLVEITLPWATLMILVQTQGPAYALGSWVPPLLYAALMAASILRLQVATAVWMSIMAAVQYGLSYVVFIQDQLTAQELAQPLLSPRMQLVRCFSLLVGGAFVAALTGGLRWAIGTAARSVRARELFGKYRLERELAQGGMGVVYQALYCPEGGFERPVAVKRIHPHLASQPQFVAAFRAEAELSARLVHANIVQVLDFGRVEDTFFLAMEYVDGLTLQQLMQRLMMMDRTMPPPLAAFIMHELLMGLEYAHASALDSHGKRLRVIHRDLSPHNVLLARTGQVKVSDFGIARALGEGQSVMTGTVMGHFSHMAPEQARGGTLDERCDLFACGVLLWEMVTGRWLFRRPTEAAILLAVLDEPVVRPSEIVKDLNPAWDAVVMQALERDPTRRFQRAPAMRAAVDLVVGEAHLARADDLAALLASVADVVPEDDHAATLKAPAPLHATPAANDTKEVTRVERKR